MSNAKSCENAVAQARAQYTSIKEMVANLRNAADCVGREGDDRRDEAARVIHEDALSVEVRSGWCAPGGDDRDSCRVPAEYKILLCTGGPAVQIIGKLSNCAEPESARIQYQDWFTPWTDWRGEGVPDTASEIGETLLSYARCFYYAVD